LEENGELMGVRQRVYAGSQYVPIIKWITYKLSILFQQGGRSRAKRCFRSNDLFAPLVAGTNREVPFNSVFAPPQAALSGA
jgi:hypothetical protein